MDLSPETVQLANTLRAITDKSDPATRKAALELIEKKVPGTNFSELQEDRVEKKMNERFQKMEQDRASQEANQRLENQRQSLITKGYTEEDVRKIETDVMQKHGIVDYEVAAKVFQADQPASQPHYDIRGQKAWKKDNLKDMFGPNVKEKARERAFEVVAEMRHNPSGRLYG